MYSGGLDSTGMLYRLLTDAEFADYDVHVHHLALKNRENRHEAERLAVHGTLAWLREQGHRPFTFTQSEHDYTFLKRYFVFDSFWYGFMAANIVTADPTIVHVAIGRTRSDYDAEDGAWLTIANRGRDVYHATLPLELRHTRGYIFPVIRFTKQEIWDLLPAPLREMSWSCRIPSYVDGRAVACGTCPSCEARGKIVERAPG